MRMTGLALFLCCCSGCATPKAAYFDLATPPRPGEAAPVFRLAPTRGGEKLSFYLQKNPSDASAKEDASFAFTVDTGMRGDALPVWAANYHPGLGGALGPDGLFAPAPSGIASASWKRA
jgi:hypothetical protein